MPKIKQIKEQMISKKKESVDEDFESDSNTTKSSSIIINKEVIDKKLKKTGDIKLNAKEMEKINKMKQNAKSESDEESDDDELSDETISQIAKQDYLRHAFLETITHYLDAADKMLELAKEHRENMKELKDRKEKFGDEIMRYLGEDRDEIVIPGRGRIYKTQTTSKSALKEDEIKESIDDGLKESKLIKDQAKREAAVESILELINSRRKVTTKTVLKRGLEKKAKIGKQAKKGKNAKNE